MKMSLLASLVLVGTALAPAASAAMPSWSPTFGHVLGFSFELAGRDLNGTDLWGDELGGRRIAGVSYDGAMRDGEPMQAVWLDGSELHGIDVHGKHLHRDGMAGAEVLAFLDDDTLLPLAIGAAARHPDKAHRDVWGYEIWYETTAGWEPACGRDDAGQPRVAVALEGRWNLAEGTVGGGAFVDDAAAFTFACDGYVLSKCVLAGYKPWRDAMQCTPGSGCTRTSLADHHQACTRALRADYFGDGMPHTADGVLVNLYDGLGIRYDSEPWSIEAEWDAMGARCVNAPRLSQHDPAVASLHDPSCGAGALASGALLVTEAPR